MTTGMVLSHVPHTHMCEIHVASSHWVQYGGHDHKKGFGEGGNKSRAFQIGEYTGDVVQNAVPTRCAEASWVLELSRCVLWTSLDSNKFYCYKHLCRK